MFNPRPPAPEMERMQRQSQEYKRLVEQRFRETQKPGTIGGMDGGGIIGMHEGVGFGEQGFHY